MSHAHSPRKPLFSFGSPFKTLKPKGSYLSPNLMDLLNSFEVTLSGRLRDLKPNDREEILSLSWMKHAVESLSATYTDIHELITALELPVCDWDEKWVDVYLDNSIKLLDICIAFSSEISRVSQAHLYLQSFFYNLDNNGSSANHAKSALDRWRQHIGTKNPRMENCYVMLNSLIQTLDLPKIKNSAKGKVLMRAMYGLKVATVFVCNVFATAFTGSSMKLLDVQLSETYLWSEAFTDLQAFVNFEIRNLYSNGSTVTVLKELDVVHTGVKELCLISDTEPEAFKNSVTKFRGDATKLSQGLDNLAKVEDGFFQNVLAGRDALLCNLRVDGTKFSSPRK